MKEMAKRYREDGIVTIALDPGGTSHFHPQIIYA
jgi:hypothetical protein